MIDGGVAASTLCNEDLKSALEYYEIDYNRVKNFQEVPSIDRAFDRYWEVLDEYKKRRVAGTIEILLDSTGREFHETQDDLPPELRLKPLHTSSSLDFMLDTIKRFKNRKSS